MDWKRKLTSRKLWMAVVELIIMVMCLFGVAEDTISKVAAMFTSAAVVIGYIIGEGLTDAAAVDKQTEEQ